MSDQDLFTDEAAETFFKAIAGQPYQPSNGSEGAMFMYLWCDRCKADAAFRDNPDEADGCWIIAATMVHDADDPEYPKEWRFSPRGQPICTAFEAKDGTSGANDPPREAVESFLPDPLDGVGGGA